MLRKTIIAVILIVGIGAAVFILRSPTFSHIPGMSSTKAVLPGNFPKIVVGMSEQDVLALVGKPMMQVPYVKFQHKTQAQWAALKSKIDAETAGTSVYDDTVNFQLIRDNAEYTHRYHDMWRYKPTPAIIETLFFDEYHVLQNIGYAPVPKSKDSASAA